MSQITEIYSRPVGQGTLQILQDMENSEEFSCRLVTGKGNRVIQALVVTKPGIYRIYEIKDVEKIFRAEIERLERNVGI